MPIAWKVRRVQTCSSTNDLAREMALAGEEEGVAVISKEQSRGRGRMGRSWYSVRGKGLYLSVILRPPFSSVSLLPLAAGLAVREALLDSTGVQIFLKWPNDLIWEGKKMGGILCESGFSGNRLNHVILGIGLNLNHLPEDFPPEIRSQATSLRIAREEEVNADEILQGLWPALDCWYDLFLRKKKRTIIAAFEKHSALPLGKEVAVITEKERFHGIFKGIEENGGIVLEDSGKRRVFFSGDTQSIMGP
ncbi:MAG: biotin--[acetyl-CoA-carboxylase] ligase [Candidatus Aminicenantales bacterium]